MKKTNIFKIYHKYNAKIINFNGWSMPLYYSNIISESLSVRNNVGLFDVSNMGEFLISGEEALNASNLIFTIDILKIKNGQSAYSLILNSEAKIIDDVIIYRISNNKILICVNAGDLESKLTFISNAIYKNYKRRDVKIENKSSSWSQVSIQGPMSNHIISLIYDDNNIELKKNFFLHNYINGIKCESILSRTGYTGEIGYEIFVPWDYGAILFDYIIKFNKYINIIPCGLGARDILRIEAGYCLYGKELNANISPVDSRLMWTVNFEKSVNFVGMRQLLKKKNISKKILIGLILSSNSIARYKNDIYIYNEKVGFITSGTYSPLLKKSIALGYININYLKFLIRNNNFFLFIKIRNKLISAKLIKLPFYKNYKKLNIV